MIPNQFENTAISAEEFIRFFDAALFGETEQERKDAWERFKKRVDEVKEAQENAKGKNSNN